MAWTQKVRSKRWPQRTDEEYAQHWIAKVRQRVVVDANGCWLWQGFVTDLGYGLVNYRSRASVRVHRKMYECTHGVTLRRDQAVCHTCDVRRCVNPEHLWLGDMRANLRDMRDKGRDFYSQRTHCERGHEYAKHARSVRPTGPKGYKNWRACVVCQRARNRIRAGWPEDLAYSMPAVPHGHRPVKGKFKRRSQTA